MVQKKLTKYIVITRPAEENKELLEKLQQLKYNVFSFPTIQVEKNILSQKEIDALQDLSIYDWILFTSRNGVLFFFEVLQGLNIDINVVHKVNIAAVGPKTAEEIEEYGLSVSFIPSIYTTEVLGQELPDVKGKNILLPRSAIANNTLTDTLQKKGAHVTTIPIYTTKYVSNGVDEFVSLVDNGQVYYLTFTSPSTIHGFMQNMKNQEKILSLPIVSIGPVTRKVAKQYGFTTIYTASVHTTDGMIQKLQEIVL